MCIDDYILEHPIEFRGVFIGKDIVSTFTKRRKKMKILKAMCAAAVALSLVGCAQTTEKCKKDQRLITGLYGGRYDQWCYQIIEIPAYDLTILSGHNCI